MKRWVLLIFVVLLNCPFPLAAEATSTPFGGSIRALAVDGENPDTIYGATSNEVFRGKVSERRWSPLGYALSGKVIQTLYATKGSVYAGTSTGVYKNLDGGATWQSLNNGLDCLDVTVIAGIQGTLFVGTSNGMYSSYDGGLSWIRVEEMQGLSIQTIVADPRDNRKLLAGTSKGLFKSQDAGVTWADGNGGINPSNRYIQSIKIDAELGVTCLGTIGGDGVLRSTDGGNTWLPIAAGLPEKIIWDVLVTGQNLLVATYGGVYRSNDQGATWVATGAGGASSAVKVLISDLAGGIYAGGMRFGVLKSNDLGDTWQDANAGLTGVQVNAVVSPSADKINVAANEGAYLTVDAGFTWRRTDIDDAKAIAFSKTSSKYYLGAKGLFVSDDGQSWHLADGASFWIQALAVSGGVSDLIYAGSYNGIYSSIDQGHTWTKLSGESLSSVLCITLIPNAPDVIIAGTMNGVFRSADGGVTWNQLNLGVDLAVSSVAVDEQNTSVLYASTAVGLYKSSDDGATWSLTDPSAEISGAQTGLTNNMPLELNVAGKDIISYRYAINEGPYSAETAVDTPIDFSAKVSFQGDSYTVGSESLQAKLDERSNFIYPHLRVNSSPNPVEIYYLLNSKAVRLLDDNFLGLTGSGASSLNVTLQTRSGHVPTKPTLRSLRVAGGILSRDAGGANHFVLKVPPSTAQIALTPLVYSELDVVTVAGSAVIPGDETPIVVEDGGIIDVVITAPGGASSTYAITVTVDATLPATTDHASYYLRSDNPLTDWLKIDNGGASDAKIDFKLNGRPYASAGEIAAAVRAMPDEYQGEPLQRKIWRFIQENSYHFDPYTDEPWNHSPTLYFASIGFGYCGDVASLYYQLATDLGLSSRVWALDGHIVPEVKVAGRWEMYDPDMEVYYYNRQGQIAGVEELASDRTLVTNPTQPFWIGWSHVYDSGIADLYAPAGNYVSDYYKLDNIKGVSLHFIVPAGGALDLPSRFLRDPGSLYGTNPPEYTQARLTLPQGWSGDVDTPLVIQSLRNVFSDGPYKVSVIGKDSAGRWQELPTVSAWTLDTTAPQVSAQQLGAVYDPLVPVTLQADEEATVYYTVDGTVPSTSSPTYAAPLDISAGMPVRFFAADAAGNVGISQVYPEQLTSLTLTASPDPEDPEQTVLFKAAAGGGTGTYEYWFFLFNSTTGSYDEIRPYSDDPVLKWHKSAAQSGIYAIEVFARNRNSSAFYEKKHRIVYVNQPAARVVLAASSWSPVVPGGKVTFSAQASGGSGSYEYAFALYNPKTVESTPVQPYSTARSWTWNTASFASGTYSVKVRVRNTGSTASYEAEAGGDFTVMPPPVSSVAVITDLGSPQQSGAKVTFAAQAAGGSGRYEYDFALYNKKTAAWTSGQPYSGTERWTWDTAQFPLGTYMLKVFVRNEGSTAQYESQTELDFTLASPVSSVAVITDRLSPQLSGPSVTFAAQASGGSGSYEYYFTWFDPNSGKWNAGRAYNRANTWTWVTTGLHPGTYVFEVWARNAGSTAPFESYKRKSFTIAAPLPATSLAVTADHVSPQQVGSKVTFSAQASGGIGSYEYYFTWYNPNTSKWSTGRSYSNTGRWVWDTSGLVGGDYTVEVWARSAGSTAQYESYKRKSFTIATPLPATSVAVTADRVSPQQVGSKVTFSAQANGGIGSYEYYFTWYNPNTGKWSTGRNYSSTGSWVWDTSGLVGGDYTVEVWARNAGSAASLECYRRTVFSIAAPSSSVSLVPDLVSPQQPGPKVRFAAQIRGGSGSYEYYFTWYSISTGQWKAGKAYSSTNYWDWDTSSLESGGYIIEVWARPSGSQIQYETWGRVGFTIAPFH